MSVSIARRAFKKPHLCTGTVVQEISNENIIGQRGVGRIYVLFSNGYTVTIQTCYQHDLDTSFTCAGAMALVTGIDLQWITTFSDMEKFTDRAMILAILYYLGRISLREYEGRADCVDWLRKWGVEGSGELENTWGYNPEFLFKHVTARAPEVAL